MMGNGELIAEIHRLVNGAEKIPTQQALSLILALQAGHYDEWKTYVKEQKNSGDKARCDYLELVETINDRLDKQDDKIEKIRKKTLLIFFDEYKTVSVLLIAFFLTLVIFAQDVLVPIVVSVLGIPLP